MDIFTFVSISLLLIFVVIVLFPLLNRRKINNLETELSILRHRVLQLEQEAKHKEQSPQVEPIPATLPPEPFADSLEEPAWVSKAFTEQPETDLSEIDSQGSSIILDDMIATPMHEGGTAALLAEKQESSRLASQKSDSIEKNFGMKLPVWIGGIALIFAGFYLVKYSIDAGLLSPMVRVILSALFGVALTSAGDIGRRKLEGTNGIRIAQSLTGAGIAVLYGSVFAATSIYGFLTPTFGFVTMAVITTCTVYLSLLEGVPIAILGMVGGFVTPAMVGATQPNGPVLFSYLLILFVGLHVLVRHRRWWALSFLCTLFAYAWTTLWIVTELQAGDSLWLVAFIIGVVTTVITTTHKAKEESAPEAIPFLDNIPIYAIQLTAIAGGLLLTASILFTSGFTIVDWGLFALLSLGCLVLALFKRDIYGYVPPAATALTMALLLTWTDAPDERWALVTLGFTALNIIGSYLLFIRDRTNLISTLHLTAACLGYYLLAFGKLQHAAILANVPGFWAILGLLLSLPVAKAAHELWLMMQMKQPQSKTIKHNLSTLIISTAALVTIGCLNDLTADHRPLLLAAEILALGWLYSRSAIQALTWTAGAISTILTFMVIAPIANSLLGSLIVAPVVLEPLRFSSIYWIPVHALIAATSFLTAARFFGQEDKNRLSPALEFTAMVFLLLGGHYLLKTLFALNYTPGDEPLILWRHAAVSNLYFAMATASLFLGWLWQRRSFELAGIAIFVLALCRMTVFDLIGIADIPLGDWPVVNGLIPLVGFPAAWVWLCSKLMRSRNITNVQTLSGVAVAVLGFLYLNLNIRQLFHGSLLHTGSTTNPELYAYSAAWLIFGIGLLFLGMIRGNKTWRYGSLAVIILAVAKVFLYDASELTGLLRVASFLGLGLSLLGLSWFYSRFIFRDQPSEENT